MPEGSVSSSTTLVRALLPKVAVEQGWSAKEFLKHACLKAGLHARAWEEAETEVLVFEAEEFSEGAA